MEHLYANLEDKDSRVRSAAASALCTYVNGYDDFTSPSSTLFSKMRLYNDLVRERIFRSLPAPLCEIFDECVFANNGTGVENRLAKVLFRLTNELLNFGEKHLQVGGN